MPLYEFQCRDCGHKTELRVKYEDRPKILECEKCKGESVQVIARSNFELKGAGWTEKFHR